MTGRIERHEQYPNYKVFYAAPAAKPWNAYTVHPETYECEGRKLTHHRLHTCDVVPDSEGFIDVSITLEGNVAKDKIFMIEFDNGFNYTPEISVSLCDSMKPITSFSVVRAKVAFGTSACVLDKNAVACKVRVRNETEEAERPYKLKIYIHGQYE